MTPPSALHLEALLQRDLDLIRTRLLEMAGLAKQALALALEAFLKRDRQLAYSVILRDQDVDALENELDHLCLEFITRHQPAAGHLRFVYAASKVVSQLERIGDYAESIARQVLLLSSIPFDIPTGKFCEIADLAIPMLDNAVRAYLEKNADLAQLTMRVEPRVNQVRDELSADLVKWREDGRLPLEALTPLITIARRFERVSDQATNICEAALYFATGEYMRHAHRVGFRVLFVDETHGCLSRLAEAAGNMLGTKRFSFSSAGIAPEPLDPRTAAFLLEKGAPLGSETGRSLADIPELEQVQVVVALSTETEHTFPQELSKALGLRWSLPDPSVQSGPPQEIRAAYDRAFESLRTHARDLTQAILGNP